MHTNRLMLVVVILLLLAIPVTRMAYAQDVISVSFAQPVATPTEGSVTIEVDVDSAEEAAETAVDLTEATGQATLATTERWLNALNTMPQNQLLQLLFVIGGVLLLVGGWRIYDWVILLAGGFVGAAILTSLTVPQALIIEVMLALVGFAIGALLAVFVYYVAVFAVGGYLGILIVSGLAGAFGVDVISPFILLIVAIVAGGILVGFASEMVVIIAALVGAQLLSLALGLAPFWTALLAVLSVVAQFYLANRFNYNIRRRPNRRLFRRTT